MRNKPGCLFSVLLLGIAADFSVREGADKASDSVNIWWKIKLNQHEKAKAVHHLKNIWLTDG